VTCDIFRECNYSYNFHHGVAVYSIYAYNSDAEYSYYSNNDGYNRVDRYFLPARLSKRGNSYGNVAGWLGGWLSVTAVSQPALYQND